MKGGVGKTTVTMHLGVIFAVVYSSKKNKILLIDFDPQFNLSQAFIPPETYFRLEKEFKTVRSVLIDDKSESYPYKVQYPRNETPPKISELIYEVHSEEDWCIDLIPSTLDLMYLALGQPQTTIEPILNRFAKFIGECRQCYDYIFIDCHPAGSIFTKCSLRNSDHVLIPVIPQGYAVRGIALMLEFIDATRLGTKGPEPHILFNFTDGKEQSEIEKEIRNNERFADKCMVSTLKKYKVFSEPLGGEGFVWNSQKPHRTKAFDNLLEVSTEFINRIEAKK
jgi:chromosome partitioning protein